MSIKSKVLAAAATLTLVGGVGVTSAVTAGSASAATPSCGNSCINVFSQQFGTHRSPNYALTCSGRARRSASRSSCSVPRTSTRPRTGPWRSRARWPTSSRPAWSPPRSTCTTAAARPGFPNDPAFENEYAPFGVDSGLCLGVAATAFNDEGVTLQPCGVSSKTVWILDFLDSFNTFITGGYVPLINGSDTNFSHPFVLTYPNISVPTDKPRPQLVVTNITGSSNASPPTFIPGPVLGTVNVDQLWGADFGILK